MERVRKYIDHMGLYVAALLKWIVVGGLVGGVGGVVGALFHLGVNYATEVRLAHPWVLYLLPVGGLVIAGLYKLCRLEGKGTNAIIESVHFGSDVPLLLVPLIFVSTVITHLCGGSAGREGAALQIGGGRGAVSRQLRDSHRRPAHADKIPQRGDQGRLPAGGESGMQHAAGHAAGRAARRV